MTNYENIKNIPVDEIAKIIYENEKLSETICTDICNKKGCPYECVQQEPNCLDCFKQWLNSEIKETQMKDIDHYPKHSNKTLMSWTKKRLVEEIEILLHNWDVECERAENISNYAKQLQEKLDKIQNDNWISVEDKMPEERDSVFKKVYKTSEWNNAMFKTISNDVLITLKYEDGTRQVTTGRTRDGKWKFSGIRQAMVTHWRPFPEPPKEK